VTTIEDDLIRGSAGSAASPARTHHVLYRRQQHAARELTAESRGGLTRFSTAPETDQRLDAEDLALFGQAAAGIGTPMLGHQGEPRRWVTRPV
jgi:hypothetical protein